MAIDLGELTGAREQAALNGEAKIHSLIGQILALDTQLNGAEDPELRAEHDLIVGYTIRQFLYQCLKKGFYLWLKEMITRRRTLRNHINAAISASAEQDAADNEAADTDEVGGFVGDL